jgi:23S rRNA pseudouridine955/2504/2580 synthase
MSLEGQGRELVAGADDAGRRLDRILRSILGGRSLSSIYSSLRRGLIKVNGAKAEPGLRLAEGDRIFIHYSLESSEPGAKAEPPGDKECGFSSIADILILATEDLLFVNKPRGLQSQGDEELEGRIRRALAFRSAASLSFSPGPLHRLDRNTTGIMTFPGSAAGARRFTELLRNRSLVKRYLALVDGVADAPAEWRDRIIRDGEAMRSFVFGDGEEALASMKPVLSNRRRSLILVELHTGLTHQIRVQASSRGMPLSGDRKYGGSDYRGGYILHAFSLAFREPPFPDVPSKLTAPLPRAALERLDAEFGSGAMSVALEALSSE